MADVQQLMLEQLKLLRGDVQGTNDRLDRAETSLRQEIQGTNERLDQTNVRLDKLDAAMADLATQMLVLGRFVRNVSE